ncbi:MAG: LysR family transcriptional regulator [Bacteroidales bacterium]|nr:LysR family transcriptional regulator [Bacteroidales bacterium]
MVEDFKLRVFVEVASLSSFTKAAQKLGVSQPAISQNIADLEKNLSVKLFERMRGEVLLTDAGKAFLQYANNILYWYKAADNMFGTVGSSAFSKQITISADTIVSDCILPPVLSSIISSNAKARFSVLPVGENSDITIYAKLRTDAINFDSYNNIIGILPATIVASSGAYDSITSGRSDFDSAPICCYSLYKDALPLDLRSRVICYSESLELVRAMISSSDTIVGILPQIALSSTVNDSLKTIDFPLPYLQADIFMQAASSTIEESLTFKQLKKILADSLI